MSLMMYVINDNMSFFFTIVFFITVTKTINIFPRFYWKCIDGKCLKTLSKDTNSVPFAECKLTCLPYAGLWPKPTLSLNVSRKLISLNSAYIHTVKFQNTPIRKLIKNATKRFLKRFYTTKKPNQPKKSLNLKVILNVIDTNLTRLTLQTSERYRLFIKTFPNKVCVKITGVTFFGVRHGLETLLQLIVHSKRTIKIISDAIIEDYPLYPYRGIMLDTARHYISVHSIKKTIEGMAMNKLNTFHWHITDAESFPYVSKTYPELSILGAYSIKKKYTSKDISDIIKYALIRGVRVIPEFDAPAHIGEGWQNWQNSGVVIQCNNSFQSPCSQLNPTLKKTYNILQGIYSDLIQDFNPELFHMGGDEVSLSCWMEDESIKKWMANKNWEFIEENFVKLLNYFQENALKLYRKQQKKDTPIIIWNGILSEIEYLHYLPKNEYIIQVWNVDNEKYLINRGYKIILSNVYPFYLDCGFDNQCKNYNSWKDIYNYRISNEIKLGRNRDKIIGSEVAVWTEKIDESYLDSRIWPRASAMAEIFWSNPDETISQVEQRFLYHRERFIQTGINAEAIETEWCVQNE